MDGRSVALLVGRGVVPENAWDPIPRPVIHGNWTTEQLDWATEPKAHNHSRKNKRQPADAHDDIGRRHSHPFQLYPASTRDPTAILRSSFNLPCPPHTLPRLPSAGGPISETTMRSILNPGIPQATQATQVNPALPGASSPFAVLAAPQTFRIARRECIQKLVLGHVVCPHRSSLA